MQLLKDVLFQVSNALLFPCLVLLVAGLGRTLVHVGGFVGEWLVRRRAERAWAAARSVARPEDSRALVGSPRLPRRVREFAALLDAQPWAAGAADRYLDDLEAELTRRVDGTALLSKLGPMLGLAGTLIPLGPALQGMAAGDVSALAGNLIVAFTATVVGLAIAGPCYAISTVRRRWYEGDLRELEHLRAAVTAAAKEPLNEYAPAERLVP